MVGGRFQDSHPGPDDGYVDLYTMTSTPPEGVFTEVSVLAANAYRYVCYVSASDGYGNVAEIEFYSSN